MLSITKAALLAATILSAGGTHRSDPPARDASLGNGLIRAEFGARGLTALTNVTEARTFRFARDEFRVVIDGQAFSSTSLPAPARTSERARVSYTWSAPPYRLQLTYELQAGWRFLSKQLFITSARDSFKIDDVALLEDTLAEQPAEFRITNSGRTRVQTSDYGAVVRFADGHGLLITAQNPFLHLRNDGRALSLRYAPDLPWRMSYGRFASDRALLAPYRSTGRKLPAQMRPEWKLAAADSSNGLDEAEIATFSQLVRAFLLTPTDRPHNVFVGWCANDYQIDVGTADGRTEYKRLIDRAAELGAQYVLYAPSNSELSRREESIDDWSWEHVLWLDLGQKLRRGEWNARTSPVPASVDEMLAYARSRNVKLLAYVYPVLPFLNNPEWQAPRSNPSARPRASLAVRSFQDWLIQTLVDFHQHTGIGGYAFDHTFLSFEGSSRYAQWYGWRRVMEELRRRVPDIVIDGRQAYHLYGSWSWLAGTYPHPTFNDEQPESFVPFPDLHFDRVSADRERFTAFLYRNYEFAPSEIVPGFITHQTSRSDETDDMPSVKTDRGVLLKRFRARDWDYLGWRYSLLSSIAVGGWNNVINMIPARDLEEYRNFSEADKRWFRQWIDWTTRNKEFLRHTRSILAQPAMGNVDGTSAIMGDSGYIFLFNPNARRMTVELPLDETTGLQAHGAIQLRELHPRSGRLIASPRRAFWNAGERVSIALDGGSAVVLEVRPAQPDARTPTLFNAAGAARIVGNVLRIDSVRGEVGTADTLLVRVPDASALGTVSVNGVDVIFTRADAHTIRAPVHFAGTRFASYQQVGAYDPAFTGGTFSARFTIPPRVFDQLQKRREQWPIPWTSEDFRTTWLAPERLLLFVQIAEPDDKWEARLRINGRVVELRKAYSAVRAVAHTFVGFYADVSLLEPDREYLLELDLPPLKPGQFQGVFFENVEPEFTERVIE